MDIWLVIFMALAMLFIFVAGMSIGREIEADRQRRYRIVRRARFDRPDPAVRRQAPRIVGGTDVPWLQPVNPRCFGGRTPYD